MSAYLLNIINLNIAFSSNSTLQQSSPSTQSTNTEEHTCNSEITKSHCNSSIHLHLSQSKSSKQGSTDGSRLHCSRTRWMYHKGKKVIKKYLTHIRSRVENNKKVFDLAKVIFIFYLN